MLPLAEGFVAGCVVGPVVMYFVIRNNVKLVAAWAKRLGIKLP